MLISYEMKSAGSNRRFYDDIARPLRIYRTLRVPVERDHGFRWKMITQSGGT
jgi:hypothetical protein